MMKFNSVALATLATVVAASGCRQAVAGPVDLTSTPMVSDLTKVVAPNVHFILDDSGSMNDDFMPDSVDGNQSRMCFRNFGYNKIYYNPATTYLPPVNSDGTPFAAATYTAAKVNGFQAASATTDLSATQSVQVRLTADPFAAVNGSKTVTVTHANHGLATGASVSFTNLSGNLRGLTLTGTFTITKVNDNSYRITSSTNANSTRAVGGASPPARISACRPARTGSTLQTRPRRPRPARRTPPTASAHRPRQPPGPTTRTGTPTTGRA